jgi:hypothetical protein
VDTAVDNPVDESALRGITPPVVWMNVWIIKVFQIASWNLLRRLSGGGRNSLVAGNGDRTGGDPGNTRKTGKLVL